MLSLELDVLKPANADVPDDAYEIFILTDARVTSARDRRLVSLLDADGDMPVVVEGRLEPPARRQQQCLRKKPYKAVHLQIKNVTRFSYGLTDGGDVVLWALGEAGWYQLEHAVNYQAIYRSMVQAVDFLYFAMDSCIADSKNGGATAETLFQAYADDERFVCHDAVAVKENCHCNRVFFLKTMCHPSQDVEWRSTKIFAYLKKHFPKDAASAQAQTMDARKTRKDPEDRPRNAKKHADGAPKKDHNWWKAAAIWELIQKAASQGVIAAGQVDLDRVAKVMVKRYDIDDVKLAKQIISVHGHHLRYMMSHPRRRSSSSASIGQEPIYCQLVRCDVDAALASKAMEMELRPRRTHALLHHDVTSESDSGSDATPSRHMPRKGKFSTLRLRSSKFSAKGKGKGRNKGKIKLGKPGSLPSNSDGELEMVIETYDQQSLDESSLPKRKHTDNCTSDMRPNKRIAHPSSPSSPASSSSGHADVAASNSLPLRWRRRNPATQSPTPTDRFRPSVVSTPLPSYAANGPGDSWNCPLKNCTASVYGASSDNGRKLISEHLQSHAPSKEQKIDLVKSEEVKCRLPVTNLIQRIRELADHQQQPLALLANPAGPSTSHASYYARSEAR